MDTIAVARPGHLIAQTPKAAASTVSSMFNNAQGNNIHNNMFVTNISAERLEQVDRGMNALSARTESGAPYDSAAREDVPKCHENTRLAIIGGIHKWACSGELDASPFMWMHGPPGSGKTTIMQTVAEICDNGGSLAASFFFSRQSAERPRDKKHFVVTIAHQFSLSIPSLKQHIADAVEDSSLLDKSLIKQLDTLVVGPLNALDISEVGGRHIIMVDGLDECDGDVAQKDVLEVLHHFSTHVHHPFRILIASRPLPHIEGYFSRQQIAECTQTMPLHTDGQESDADIEAFVISQFNNIKEEHPSRHGLRPEWPDTENVNRIVKRSSGRFIYASAIMKYISEYSRDPETSLQTVLNAQVGDDTALFKELDALYAQEGAMVEWHPPSTPAPHTPTERGSSNNPNAGSALAGRRRLPIRGIYSSLKQARQSSTTTPAVIQSPQAAPSPSAPGGDVDQFKLTKDLVRIVGTVRNGTPSERFPIISDLYINTPQVAAVTQSPKTTLLPQAQGREVFHLNADLRTTPLHRARGLRGGKWPSTKG